MPSAVTPKQFVAALSKLADPAAIGAVARFFHADPNARSSGNKILGVGIGSIFPVAKQFVAMTLADIETLLDNPCYEVRMGAVSIMDFQARAKSISAEQQQALFELYLRRHDRINNWDLVDRAAPSVVGAWLCDKPRGILDELARSANPWERRTAVVSTYAFIKQGEVEDTFRIAGLLAHDGHELVQKAVGSWVREAGKRDETRLLAWLNSYAASMPRPMLRYAVEKLAPRVRAKFMAMKPPSAGKA